MISELHSANTGDSSKPINKPMPALKENPNTSDTEQAFDYIQIDNPVTINRILNQMHFSNAKISIHSKGSKNEDHTFFSTIARVSRKNNQIIIHQLQPRTWQQHIKPGDKVEVNCFMSSGQMSFFSHIKPLDESRDNYYCILNLPDQMSKFQLRAAYRVFMPPGICKVRIKLRDAEGKLIEFDGAGLDLSQEGSCLRFVGDIFPHLAEDDMLHNLEFDLLSGTVKFTTDAHICRVSDGQLGQKIAGVQFLPLPDAVKKQLQSALAEIQRLQLRQQVQIY